MQWVAQRVGAFLWSIPWGTPAGGLGGGKLTKDKYSLSACSIAAGGAPSAEWLRNLFGTQMALLRSERRFSQMEEEIGEILRLRCAPAQNDGVGVLRFRATGEFRSVSA
jgi:hypothetical protein